MARQQIYKTTFHHFSFLFISVSCCFIFVFKRQTYSLNQLFITFHRPNFSPTFHHRFVVSVLYFLYCLSHLFNSVALSIHFCLFLFKSIQRLHMFDSSSFTFACVNESCKGFCCSLCFVVQLCSRFMIFHYFSYTFHRFTKLCNKSIQLIQVRMDQLINNEPSNQEITLKHKGTQPCFGKPAPDLGLRPFFAPT